MLFSVTVYTSLARRSDPMLSNRKVKLGGRLVSPPDISAGRNCANGSEFLAAGHCLATMT
jgi:hypothetical protein